jgi:hypothetical protein
MTYFCLDIENLMIADFFWLWKLKNENKELT